MTTAGCFEFIQISNEFPGHFKFAALDYTAPHHQDFNEEVSDFLEYATCRDGVRDFYCIVSPPGLPIAGGPQPAMPPRGLLRLPGLRTRFVDIKRTMHINVGSRMILAWFISSYLRLIINPETGEGDIFIPFVRGLPIIVDLTIEPVKLHYQVTEYQVTSACAAAA